MAENYRIRFQNFWGIDFSDARRVRGPRAKPDTMGEDTLLRGGIGALAATGNNKGKLLKNTMDRIEDGATLSTTGSIPGAVIPSPHQFTFTEGLAGGAGAGVGYGYGGGIYFWSKRPGFEIGLYGSISVGVITNIGASAGVQVAHLFGPAPSVLAGDSVAVSVTVGVDVLSITGSLLLTAPPGGFTPPAGSTLSSLLAGLAAAGRYRPTVVGIAYTLSAGISALPVDISVMPGRTWTRPVISR
jgi:hypothetical protein